MLMVKEFNHSTRSIGGIWIYIYIYIGKQWICFPIEKHKEVFHLVLWEKSGNSQFPQLTRAGFAICFLVALIKYTKLMIRALNY